MTLAPTLPETHLATKLQLIKSDFPIDVVEQVTNPLLLLRLAAEENAIKFKSRAWTIVSAILLNAYNALHSEHLQQQDKKNLTDQINKSMECIEKWSANGKLLE